MCLLSFISSLHSGHFFFFFFNDTATTEIYTLSLHDALPIYGILCELGPVESGTASGATPACEARDHAGVSQDRKSTRLNSSHANISYAVFCLKKKKNTTTRDRDA